jgi:hypothetical protein
LYKNKIIPQKMKQPHRSALNAGIILLACSAIFISCKKERPLTNNYHNPLQNAREYDQDDSAIASRIVSFYQTVEDIAGGDSVASDSVMDIDSAELLAEAALNYKYGHCDPTKDAQILEFSISEPCSSGSISLNTVAQVYRTIGDSVEAALANIEYDQKTLSLLDLTVTDNGTSADFGVYAVLIKGNTPNVPTSTVDGISVIVDDPTHGTNAWRVYAQGANTNNAAVGEDIASVNLITKSISNMKSGNAVYGAATTLRTVGFQNYCATYLNYLAISNTDMLYNLSPTYVDAVNMNAGPASSGTYTYGINNYQGYDHYSLPTERWNAREYFTSTSSTSYASYNDRIFLEWLITPMMNHYLSYIPGIIYQCEAAAVAAKGPKTIVANFQVVLSQVSSVPVSASPAYPSLYYIERRHRYIITNATVVPKYAY